VRLGLLVYTYTSESGTRAYESAGGGALALGHPLHLVACVPGGEGLAQCGTSFSSFSLLSIFKKA
jgi:hypothetical protein